MKMVQEHVARNCMCMFAAHIKRRSSFAVSVADAVLHASDEPIACGGQSVHAGHGQSAKNCHAAQLHKL